MRDVRSDTGFAEVVLADRAWFHAEFEATRRVEPRERPLRRAGSTAAVRPLTVRSTRR
ncbi:hypothetical protein ACIQMJ_32155 [Actinosynnema sp. NPDC091369]